MGDRTNIADALERMAVEAEDGYSIPAGPSEVTTFRDAARLLRADPDTSDELAAEARRLLDAATPGPWHCFTDDSAGKDQLELWCDYDDGSWREGTKPPFHLDPFCYDPTPMERATAELIAAAPRLIAALLLERAVTAEAADRSPFCTKQEYVRALDERDAERVARERAEAEARQLREAIEFTASALDFEIGGDEFPRSVRQSLLDQLAVIDAAVAEGCEDAEDTE